MAALGGQGIPNTTEFSRLYHMHHGPQRSAAALRSEILTGTGKAGIFWTGSTFAFGVRSGLDGPVQPDYLAGTGPPILAPYDYGVQAGALIQAIVECANSESCMR